MLEKNKQNKCPDYFRNEKTSFATERTETNKSETFYIMK